MKVKKIISIAISMAMLSGFVTNISANEISYIERQDPKKLEQSLKLLLDSIDNPQKSYIEIKDGKVGSGEFIGKIDTGEKSIGYEESVTYTINVEKEGDYFLNLKNKSGENNLSEFILDIKINDNQPFKEMKTIILPLKWQDESKKYSTDSYGDETAPKQVKSNEYLDTYLYDTTYSTALPLKFHLKKGENKITIKNLTSDGLVVSNLKVEKADFEIPSYNEYKEKNKGETIDSLHKINAIDYVSKNSTQAIYNTEKDPSTTPYDVNFKKLNVLNYKEGGIELNYEVEVEKDGLYELAFHYKNEKEEFDSFISIYIDNKIPFEECISYQMPSTGNKYKNIILTDDENNPYKFYLTKGKHTLTLRSEQEPIKEALFYGKVISDHVTKFGLDITKLSGSDIDKNRTWKMTKYIKDIPNYLNSYEILINEIKFLLQEYGENGVDSAYFAELEEALLFVNKMQEYPDEIALYINELTGKDASVLSSVSSFLTEVSKEDFSLDMIYIYGNNELPREDVGVFGEVKDWFMTLVASFTNGKYEPKEKNNEELTIWVNRALTHVDLLQKLADTEFTEKTGIKVNISAMPDPNKLTLATAAGDTPDVALGLLSHMPFELASRGALYDMTQFEDFWQVAGRFTPGIFVPYTYNEGVYALPETVDFNVLAYRKDIFDNLGITPPNTWNDVVDILPTLQRYGMNFYHNISAGSGYKWFYQTSSLIFQNDGKIYSDNGLSVAIDDSNSIKGLQQLGDLFINYSIDTQVNSFLSSFRYATLPIGIVDTNEYTLLKNAAPELEGQWAVAPYPGIKKSDGTIDRSYIASSTGGVIFNDTNLPKEAFEFLKWWTSHQTQVNYTHTLKSTYGNEFFWLSANLEALEDSPIPQQEKEVIVEQVKWLRDVPRTPGQYLVERSISNVWSDMVFDGISAQVAMDEKIIPINREIKKKMTELNFYDEDGELKKDYVIRDISWIKEQMQNAKGENK